MDIMLPFVLLDVLLPLVPLPPPAVALLVCVEIVRLADVAISGVPGCVLGVENATLLLR